MMSWFQGTTVTWSARARAFDVSGSHGNDDSRAEQLFSPWHPAPAARGECCTSCRSPPPGCARRRGRTWSAAGTTPARAQVGPSPRHAARAHIGHKVLLVDVPEGDRPGRVSLSARGGPGFGRTHAGSTPAPVATILDFIAPFSRMLRSNCRVRRVVRKARGGGCGGCGRSAHRLVSNRVSTPNMAGTLCSLSHSGGTGAARHQSCSGQRASGSRESKAAAATVRRPT